MTRTPGGPQRHWSRFFAPGHQAVSLLAQECGADIKYVHSELYGTLDVLSETTYDLVYTGVGALCWLPDIKRWAQDCGGTPAAGRSAAPSRESPRALGFL